MCGTFVGTFKYMSPERIKNDPYSYMSDIWSLGLVLQECATGQAGDYTSYSTHAYTAIVDVFYECMHTYIY